MTSLNRSESRHMELMVKLTDMARSPYYAHVIANMSFFSTYVEAPGRYLTEKHYEIAERSRVLLRQEISILIHNFYLNGKVINYDIGNNEIADSLAGEIFTLFEGIKKCYLDKQVNNDFIESFGNPEKKPYKPEFDALIFYAADCGADVQYQHLSNEKHEEYSEWLIKHKGFSAKDMAMVIRSITLITNQKASHTLLKLQREKASRRSLPMFFLDIFKFSADEISEKAGLNKSIVKNVIHSFCIDYQKEIPKTKLNRISEANPVTAYPILELEYEEYICFHNASLRRASYITPEYWMQLATKNDGRNNSVRGISSEEITAKQLINIFGEDNVFRNVSVCSGKDTKGEIDVLVKWGDIFCLFECKAKRLTDRARNGDIEKMREDFSRSVQKSYDQLLKISSFILDQSVVFCLSNGSDLKFDRPPKEVYLFPVVTEDFPGLPHMQRVLLNKKEVADERIKDPYVMDIFLLHAISNTLKHPLYFFDFISARKNIEESFLWVDNEMFFLADYLRGNMHKKIHQIGATVIENFIIPHVARSTDILLVDLMIKKNLGDQNVKITEKTILDEVEGCLKLRSVISQMLHCEDYNTLKKGMNLLSSIYSEKSHSST